MDYTILIDAHALRQLRKFERQVRDRIVAKIDSLADNPRPHGAEKLAGRDARYRVRVGDYRIIYEIHDDQLRVLVVAIGDRKDVYR